MFDNFNLLNLNWQNIPFQEITHNEEPIDFKIAYGLFSNLVGNLEYEDFLFKKNESQVIMVKNNNGFHMILKRTAFKFFLPTNELSSNKQAKNEINKGFKEYIIAKLVSAHPAGILPIGFQITFIRNLDTCVTEFLMENAGETLSKYKIINPIISELSKEKALKYLMQSASVLSYIERLKIVYNDIKLENLLIDYKGNLKIIDYDVAQTGGMFITTKIEGIEYICGYSSGFASPEMIQFVSKQKNEQLQKGDKVNPWKADIYSWGILALILLGALPYNNYFWIDGLKIKEKHGEILQKIKEIKMSDKDLSSRMQIILEACLNYDPQKRIDFKCLNVILGKLPTITIPELNPLIDSSIKLSNTSRNELESRVKELEKELATQKDQNNLILQLKTDLENKNSDIKLEDEKIRNLENELYGLKNNTTNVNEKGKKIEELQRIIQNKNEEIEYLFGKNKELNNHNIELEKEISNSKEALKEIINFKKNNLSLREMIEEITKAFQKLNQEKNLVKLGNNSGNKNLNFSELNYSPSENNFENKMHNLSNSQTEPEFKCLVKDTEKINLGNYLIDCNLCNLLHNFEELKKCSIKSEKVNKFILNQIMEKGKNIYLNNIKLTNIELLWIIKIASINSNLEFFNLYDSESSEQKVGQNYIEFILKEFTLLTTYAFNSNISLEYFKQIIEKKNSNDNYIFLILKLKDSKKVQMMRNNEKKQSFIYIEEIKEIKESTKIEKNEKNEQIKTMKNENKSFINFSYAPPLNSTSSSFT